MAGLLSALLGRDRERVEAEAKAAEEAQHALASASDRYAQLVTRLSRGDSPPRGLSKPEAVEALLAELGKRAGDLEADVLSFKAVLAAASSHDPAGFGSIGRRDLERFKLDARIRELEQEVAQLRHKLRTGAFGVDLPNGRLALKTSLEALPYLEEGPERSAYLEARSEIQGHVEDLGTLTTLGIRITQSMPTREQALAALAEAETRAREAWAEALPKLQFVEEGAKRSGGQGLNAHLYSK